MEKTLTRLDIVRVFLCVSSVSNGIRGVIYALTVAYARIPIGVGFPETPPYVLSMVLAGFSPILLCPLVSLFAHLLLGGQHMAPLHSRGFWLLCLQGIGVLLFLSALPDLGVHGVRWIWNEYGFNFTFYKEETETILFWSIAQLSLGLALMAGPALYAYIGSWRTQSA